MDSITSQLFDLGAIELGELGELGELAVVHERGARPTVAEALRRSAPGEVMAAQHRGRPVAVAILDDGRAFALADRCPHDGGLLSDGFVDGDRLVCARHGWEVDPCTGRCPQRPRAVVSARELRRR